MPDEHAHIAASRSGANRLRPDRGSSRIHRRPARPRADARVPVPDAAVGDGEHLGLAGGVADQVTAITADHRRSPVSTMSISRLPHREQTSRSRQCMVIEVGVAMGRSRWQGRQWGNCCRPKHDGERLRRRVSDPRLSQSLRALISATCRRTAIFAIGQAGAILLRPHQSRTPVGSEREPHYP